MRYEYRLEHLPVRGRGMLRRRLMDRLNEQGHHGWRAVGLRLDLRSLGSWSEITLLLERERCELS